MNHKDWIADLAALCAVYKDEVSVSTTQKNTKICKMIWNMTSANKIGFYFNSLRRLDLVPPQQRPQLSSGTSAVETMNFQTNKRFKNIVELYQSSVELKCSAFQFLKLFSHNCAEYCPTEYQVSQQTILDHNLSVWQFTAAEWSTIRQTSTPLLEKRKEHHERILKHPAAKMHGCKKKLAVSKRPAGQVRLKQNAIRHKVIKRHTYNKCRLP